MTQRLRAVAVVSANSAGEILILKEFVGKPALGKYEDMDSIPMETCHHGEHGVLALKRLHDEELTGLPFQGDPIYIGAYLIIPRVWVRLYAMSVEHVAPIIGQTLEVGNHRWMPVKDALGLWLRRGAREMIEDYMAGRTKVIRRYCRDVPAIKPVRA
ncbi:hypothetical protein A3C18_03005 [Candidatus Kaiserbacteria bacterium RIFCSPHIGHO2_02_FULL_54_11b]|uniref:Nudix hydrolase domain-containing protein n=2 Tax=Candidatus Kaiseribacteriota TaxID=1752734 RepID=A0A1F6CIE6_9BACT|nr:MAG: hypothetical protein A2704_03230 [Candidatus Kaiserbacteria bacterium RIFCSPHIGHO2_01_FULL_54_36b]OGG64512.1 MAG: hypothetical protein A3C18_03005 [Candidatus Kaiserbacteria bacterium RIFCSPHIGHO2_02_FULL_54_11b]